MHKCAILPEVAQLIQESSEKNSCAPLEKAEKIIENYLKDNQHDTDMWFNLALVVNKTPLADFLETIDCVKMILSYDPQNAYAALLLTAMKKHHMAVDDECLKILNAIKTNDLELLAMIEFAKSWCYEFNNNDNYWKHIKISIDLWKKHTAHFLSNISCNNKEQNLSERIKANLYVICDNITYPYDPLSVEYFLTEFIRIPINKFL
ncbi:MAG: hypothetical protein WC707_02420 [Candidatus Babeliaceae bacterium]|jgi:hypothetical protein